MHRNPWEYLRLHMVAQISPVASQRSGLVFLWREQPDDERELQNQALASRWAYLTGSVVLILALVIQSLKHDLDPAIPVALLAMIATKVIVQRNKDDK